MKKTLLATSALAGASVLAAGAANAAEAPVMTFSGNLSYEYIFVDNEIRAANGNDGHIITANEQQSELVWDARGTADNGLEYGANIQWRWARADRGFDEAWIDFRGGWGRLFLGAEDGVTGLLVPDANGVQVGTWGTDGNGAIRAQRALNDVAGSGLGGVTLHYYQSPMGHTSDANKIGYVSPSFGGFSAGVSFTPDAGDGFQANFTDATTTNAVELAARFSTDFSGVGVTVGGSYNIAEGNQAGTTSSAAGIEDIAAWNVGASVSVAGFTVAANYVDNDDSLCPTGNAACDSGQAWAVGASYSFGPGAVSVSYQAAEETLASGIEGESNIFHAGLNYQVAEGLSARVNGYHISADQVSTAGTPERDASVVIVGTRVQF